MAPSSCSRRALRIILLVILPALILTWTVIATVTIDVFGSKDWLSYNRDHAPGRVDAIVVLGAGVDHDKPSPVYEARLRLAVELFHAGAATCIVFTGGIGADDRLSEGEVGRDYAIAHGVPAEAIHFEARSRTTWQNLREAKLVIDHAGCGNRVALVSDPHHLLRSSVMAKRTGLVPYPSPTPHSRYRSISSKLPALLREFYFLHHFALFGR